MESNGGKVILECGKAKKELSKAPEQWEDLVQVVKASFEDTKEHKAIVLMAEIGRKSVAIDGERTYREFLESRGQGDSLLNVALQLHREERSTKRQKRDKKVNLDVPNLSRAELEEIIEDSFYEILPKFTDLVFKKLKQRKSQEVQEEEPSQVQKEAPTEVKKPKAREKGRGREVAYYVQKGANIAGLEEEKEGEAPLEELSDEGQPERRQRVKKPPELTHFLSFPMNNADCMMKVVEWQKEVEKQFPELVKRGLKFQNAKRIHVTLSMLPLAKEEKREHAKKIVEKLAPQIKEIVETSKLKLRFDTIDAFYYDKKQKLPRVLFITLKEDEQTSIIRKIADLVIREFVQEDILDPNRLSKYDIEFKDGQFSPARLHMTFARLTVRREQPALMEKLQSLKDFGEFTPTSFDISTRFFYEENGFYQPLLRIPLT
eukprot:TRINITY_DN26_c0_g1_i1.p1 TRINITY_DN26_c0_g1~~TRINITY_DN26_c0_g1_i1.p1  ORF type:complete len:432 (+),score=138.68 TRINITY_DN26_c0_g1_i1:69-1364(+)